MIGVLLLAVALPSAPQADDPPVRLRLDEERYSRGERGRVWVESERDGYVVALHADAEGRVRVLFPLDPTDDAFVRGGRELEVRGRGDREAFFVDAREGVGVVLAAYSPDPFRFDPFVRGDHWDYRVLGGPDVREDPERELLEYVSRMTDGEPFEYDVAHYVVGAPIARGPNPYGYGDPYYGGHFPHFRSSFYYGHPFFYGPPFFARSCFDPLFGFHSFCFRSGFAFRTGFVSRPFVFGRVRTGTIVGRPRFVIPRDRPSVTPVEPRRRTDARDSRRVRRSPEDRDAPGALHRTSVGRGHTRWARPSERAAFSGRTGHAPARGITRSSWRGPRLGGPAVRRPASFGRVRHDGRGARLVSRGATVRRRR